VQGRLPQKPTSRHIRLSADEPLTSALLKDPGYDLREIALSTGELGLAYVWPGDDVRPEDWDAEDFQSRHLEAYAARCARLAPRLAAGLPKNE
jgi:hypothetical protein